MPYTGIDDDKLPDAVKKLDEKLRAAWVKSWNASFANCQKQNGEDCESRAFAIANSVIKRMGGDEGEMQFLQAAELSADSLVDGREFDGLACGEFTDMHGRTVAFKPTELFDYLANTLAAIEATRGESGELAGLPIDAHGHEKGDGAGWIVGARVDGSKIRLLPKWTEIGRELISKGIRRFFSATVDTANRVILGGTLTNWPATRDKTGRILLRPVELSQVEGDKLMTELTVEQLKELIDKRVAEQAAAGNTGKPVDLAAVLPPEVRQALMTDLRKQAELEWRAEMERVQHETKMAELATDLTRGNASAPRGYRASADDLKAHLAKMPADDAAFWRKVLTDTQAQGFIEFTELGHSKNVGGEELPAPIKPLLRSWIEAGRDLGEFFAVNKAELGEASRYNLAEFEKKEK